MALKASTGLRKYLMETGSLKSALNNSYIDIYSGPVPASADDAITGDNVWLATFTVNGDDMTLLTFGAANADGSLPKNSSEIWASVQYENGTATFFRHVTDADDGTLSTTQIRLQGTIGSVPGSYDMVMSDPVLVAGQSKSIDSYVVSLATLA